jgi:hypothetical protein
MSSNFEPAIDERNLRLTRRAGASVELIASLLLALSTLVALTAVSIGIARAGMIGCHLPMESGVRPVSNA